jgi:hypothetical protein
MSDESGVGCWVGVFVSSTPTKEYEYELTTSWVEMVGDCVVIAVGDCVVDVVGCNEGVLIVGAGVGANTGIGSELGENVTSVGCGDGTPVAITFGSDALKVVGAGEGEAALTSAQHRKKLIVSAGEHSVEVPELCAPKAMTKPVSLPLKHVVELQTWRVSSPQPVPRVSSLEISTAVQRRAPMRLHRSFAPVQVVLPPHPLPGVPGGSRSLAEQTSGSPNASALSQPRSSHEEAEVDETDTFFRIDGEGVGAVARTVAVGAVVVGSDVTSAQQRKKFEVAEGEHVSETPKPDEP